jgi:uncharacterized membrane protein
MAMIWGIFWGVVLGGFWPQGGDFSVYVGGFLGFFAGLSLRFVVKKLIVQQHAVLSSQVRHEQRAASQRTQEEAVQAAATGSPQTRQQADQQTEKPERLDRAAGISVPAQVLPVPAHPAAAVAPHLATAKAFNEAADDHALWEDELSRADTSLDASVGQINSPLAAKAPAQDAAQTTARQNTLPAQPSPIEKVFDAARDWLMGGNTIVRVGLVILFIGLSFLARYAAVAGLLPVELRLAVIGAFGIALLTIGFKKRLDKPGFALALQGAGVAVMYLTVFAAFKLYGLLPPLLAFGLMIVVCALSCALALLQNSRALAIVAFAGGFAVPILLSTGQGSHVGLFSYYTLLNVAILLIAYKKSWRILNVLGFVATFGVATTWGALKFLPEQYASTQPFLIGFLLIYVITAVLYARNTPTQLGNAVDSTLVFGTPLVAFGLQVGLTKQFELGTAFSALGFAALHLGLATVLTRRARDNYRLLIECFIAIGVGFATLAVPLALDAKWTSAVWALEGAGAFWVGMRQARWMPRAFGLLLQGVAALAFLTGVGDNVSALPLINPAFMGALLIALPAMMIAWWLRKDLPHSGSSWAQAYATAEKQLANMVFVYGFAWWCLALGLEIHRSAPAKEVAMSYLPVLAQSTAQLLTMLAIVLSARLSQMLSLAKNWAVASLPSRITLGVMAVTLMTQLNIGARVLHLPAWLIWAAVLALHFWMLRINDRQDNVNQSTASNAITRQKLNYFVHVGGAWFVTVLLADALWYWIGQGDLWRTSWASVVLLISSVGVLFFTAMWAGRANQQGSLAHFKWPLQPHAVAYYWHAALPLALLMFVGALVVAVTSSGRTDPLPYIPLLNPTDLTLALALGGLMLWRQAVVSAAPPPAGAAWLRSPQAWMALAGLAFIAINTIWLRVAHHFFSIPWDASALFDSFVVQTGYAILWTVLALSLMLIAGRRKQRTLWLVGAGLLAVVVVKLLLIDLSNAGGAERIIAFIVVGVLMLVVGYFAPLPPKTKAAAGDTRPSSMKETS